MNDLELVLQYWKLAPQEGWSRWPIIAVGFSSLAAIWLLLALITSS